MVDTQLPEPVDNVENFINYTDTDERSKPPKQTLFIMVGIIVIAVLGLTGGLLYNYLHARHQDSTRKQDLSYIADQAETFHDFNGYYPTLKLLNSTLFGAIDLNGIDRTKFKDPSDTSEQLLSSPSIEGYAYEPIPTGCDNVNTKCQHYTLVAILSSGKDYNVDSKH